MLVGPVDHGWITMAKAFSLLSVQRVWGQWQALVHLAFSTMSRSALTPPPPPSSRATPRKVGSVPMTCLAVEVQMLT
jgi:hypothetical protein